MATKKKTYLELSAELDSILVELQSDTDIDEAIELYTRAQKIVDELEAILKTAKNKVEKITAKFQ